MFFISVDYVGVVYFKMLSWVLQDLIEIYQKNHKKGTFCVGFWRIGENFFSSTGKVQCYS